MKEQHLGSGNNTTFEIAKLYTINNTIVVKDKGDYIDLNVKIQVDLNQVDDKYHEIFVNMLTSKYLDVASFGDNLFSQCEPVVKKHWWQIWK
jgi:predicted O-linked N-acetylglucosamine transferase (SPINDLY family)